MAEMSEKKPFRVPKFKRFEVYVELKRQGKPNREIADAIGISERQLDRHISKWKDDGTLDKWILAEWIITYDALQEEKGGLKATFKGLTMWLLKRMKQQSEIEVKGTPKFIVEIVDYDGQSETESQTSPETTHNPT